MKFVTLIQALLLACGLIFVSPSAAQEPPVATVKKPASAEREADKRTAKKETEDHESIAWFSSLSEGYRHGLADRKPLVILVTAKWCEPCRKLAKELETPTVREELARWTPVRLDADAEADDANAMAAAGVPALRLRTSGGQEVAQRDGYLTAAELVEWLKSNFEAATATADDVLLSSGEPGAMAVVRLVKQFRQRNPALREAAIRRLLPYPNAAQSTVLKAFREGNLTSRLAAMELLEQWKAPLGDLDPWRPESFTPEHLARLEKWQERVVPSEHALPKQPAPEKLTPAELATARRQIERMLHADEAEADAIRQRMAGLGAALLPEVYSRLKEAATDQDRRRLLVLRYRLAAPDALVLRWPGGLERLGDNDPRQRRQAAEELAKLAGDSEKALLLELFADTDPLVREISLRGLQHIGGKEAEAELVKLLSDPEPNVRAAVLKQLEETPDAAMVPAVIKYLKTEKDPDLIVHGICFLRATKGGEALKCLMSLLKHESWQVRAEAAVGIGKLSGESDSPRFHRHFPASPTTGDGDDAATKLQVDAYVALLDLLDDSDGFVVAKAVEGLSNADMALAVEPLVKVADKHPDLATSVLEILARGTTMRKKAIPHLRAFCKHPQPKVRAAAITALCGAAPDDVADELVAALGDTQSEVRISAASALFGQLNNVRQEARNKAMNGTASGTSYGASVVFSTPEPSLLATVTQFFGGKVAPPAPVMAKPATEARPAKESKTSDDKTADKKTADKKTADNKTAAKAKKPGEAKPEEEVNPQDQWLVECYAGRHRAKWLERAVAPLEKMLAAASPKERVTAALALVPLGKAAAAMPVLCEAVRAQPDQLDLADEVLPWLPLAERLKIFGQLRVLAKDGESRARLIEELSVVPDRRAGEPLWDLLADAKVTVSEARELQAALTAAYLGARYYSSSEVSPADRRALVKVAKPRTTSGSDMQRTVALALMASIAPDDAAEAAARLADDGKLSSTLRTDAFQIQLITQDAKDSRKTALAAIRARDAARKKLALKYLVYGPEELRVLHDEMYVNLNNTGYISSRNGTPIVPKPPAGVTAADVRPLLADGDAEVAACAGYLLAVLGEADGIEPLLHYWRQHRENSAPWNKLAYQAIAVIDDPQYIPVLREIRSKLEEGEISEFYWTIRIMSGPEILKFRKQIREEVGTSQLGM